MTEPPDKLPPARWTAREQRIETPSWAYGNSGTRFKVFAQEGVPRDPYEKIADAATRCTASPAWRRPSRCTSRGTGSTTTPSWPRTPPTWACALGTINANVFQDDDYMLGSVTNPDPRVRRKATDHLLECVDVMDADRVARPQAVVLRRHQLPGPGRHPAPARTGWPRRCGEVYERLGDDQRMLLEYKLFEPAFYTTDVPDWGTAYAHCLELGQQAQVVIDTGHHAPGTNIEFIVAFLLRAGKLGGSTSTPASTPTTT